MKKKSITGIIVVALFIIGIIAALIVYKKVQTMPGEITDRRRTGDSNIKCR